AVFVGCAFKRADFYWASLYRARFVNCTFEEVCFRGASMMATVFVACNLVRCDFSYDNLGGDTDLTPVVFHDCKQQKWNFTHLKRDGRAGGFKFTLVPTAASLRH